MAHLASLSFARQLGSLLEGGSAAGLSDRQLLERFTAARDESAFAAIVARHGPMVLGVCRQLLGDHHDAEDAFQAVFLVLARQTRSIRDPEALGPWLYGVALRTARKARARLARRRQTEEAGAAARPEARPDVQAAEASGRERAEALHGEVERLPEPFRRAVVACYFEGLSPDEAARRLRWSSGTLRSRLVRARERLRRGLTRRGLMLSTTGFAAALAPRSASASVSPLLCASTARAAITFAARTAAGGALAAPAPAIAQEILRTMLAQKIRSGLSATLALAAVAAGAGWLALAPALGGRPMNAPSAPAAQAAPKPQAAPDPATSARMTVVGRVLRPDGTPAAGAPVDIVATSRAPEDDTDEDRAPYILLGQGNADADGRFRIDAARSSSSRFSAVYALAGAPGPGSAFGCAKLHPDAEQPDAAIRLRTEQPIRGRLVDINGQPAAGVEVRLKGAYGAPRGPGDGLFETPALPGRGPVWPAAPPGLRTLPGPVKTDAQGRFTLHGLGHRLHALLIVRDPRFARQRFDLKPEDLVAGKEVSLALHPATILEGRVLAADTGRPIPQARISVRSSFGPPSPFTTSGFRADDRGHFRINPDAGDTFGLRAVPPEGQPYLPAETEIAWTKGAIKKEVDLTLPRGVLIRGRVTEEGAGRPVPGVSVQSFTRRRPGGMVNGAATTGEDGTYQLAVPPGPGTLMVLAPSLDYVIREIGGGRLYGGRRPGGLRFYAHDIIAFEVKDGEASHELNPTLRPGRTVRGRVVGPSGETVADAVALTRQQFDPHNLLWLGQTFIRARDGRFELPGFHPDRPSPAYFLDPEHEWGAAVEFSGRQAGEEVTARLQPCGTARARFVGPDGKPVARLNIMPYFHLLMTPGTARTAFVEGEELAADEAFLSNFDFKHYPNGPSTDADGRVVLPDLIPGAPYRIADWSTVNDQARGIQLRRDFTVRPGETIDLGEILVEKPRTP